VETYIIVYPRDAVTSLKEHKLYKNFIPLVYNGIEYDSTDNLGRKNRNLVISGYFASQNLNKGDEHLTLDGHKIISDSIYNRIIETIK
jgi:hypothetical protein